MWILANRSLEFRKFVKVVWRVTIRAKRPYSLTSAGTDLSKLGEVPVNLHQSQAAFLFSFRRYCQTSTWLSSIFNLIMSTPVINILYKIDKNCAEVSPTSSRFSAIDKGHKVSCQYDPSNFEHWWNSYRHSSVIGESVVDEGRKPRYDKEGGINTPRKVCETKINIFEKQQVCGRYDEQIFSFH